MRKRSCGNARIYCVFMAHLSRDCRLITSQLLLVMFELNSVTPPETQEEILYNTNFLCCACQRGGGIGSRQIKM